MRDPVSWVIIIVLLLTGMLYPLGDGFARNRTGENESIGWGVDLNAGFPTESGGGGSAFGLRLETPPLGSRDGIRTHLPTVHFQLLHSDQYAAQAGRDFGLTSLLMGVSSNMLQQHSSSRVAAGPQARVGAVHFRRDDAFGGMPLGVILVPAPATRSEWAPAVLLGLRTTLFIDDRIQLHLEGNGGFIGRLAVTGRAQLDVELYKGLAATAAANVGHMFESDDDDVALDDGSVFFGGGGMTWSHLMAGISYRY